MTLWTFLTIIVVAAIISEVIKSNYKMKAKTAGNLEPRIEALENKHKREMESLRNRVRNLETIAASDPDDFQRGGMNMDVDLDAENPEELNQKLVNQLARNKNR